MKNNHVYNNEKDESIYFKCNGCGKCCNGYVSLTIDDCFRLQDEFIISLMWRIQPVGVRKVLNYTMNDDEIDSEYNELKKSFATLTNKQGREFFVQIFPVTSDYSKNVCSKLSSDGKCTIYEKRPHICKNIPFQPISPIFLQGEILKEFSQEFDCVVLNKEKEYPLLFKNNIIMDDAFKDNFDHNKDVIFSDSLLLSNLMTLVNENHPIVPSMHSLLESEGGWLETGLVPFALALRIHGTDGTQLNNLFTSQIKLIEQEIDKAIKRKNKDELEKTRLLRKNLDNYKKIIPSFQSD